MEQPSTEAELAIHGRPMLQTTTPHLPRAHTNGDGLPGPDIGAPGWIASRSGFGDFIGEHLFNR